MTTHPALTLRRASGLTTVMCLSGDLGPDTCSELERELRQQFERTRQEDRRLVLDLAGVRVLSTAACETLQTATAHLAHAPVPVVGATPAVRAVLEHTKTPGLRLHNTLVDAVAATPDATPGAHTKVFGLEGEVLGLQGEATGPQSELFALQDEVSTLRDEAGKLQDEVFGLRARARSRALIGVAQGILVARYELAGPAAAFDLLRESSQHHNVPLRVLASAVVTAPAPPSDAHWFAGRGTRTPPPATGLPHRRGIDARDRRQVLATALNEAAELTGAESGELHLTNSAHNDALELEQHHGLAPDYRDQTALVAGPPHVSARAQAQGEAVTVPDVTADPDLADHPVGRALLAQGSRALHSVPLITPEGNCTGTLTLHRTTPGSWLTPEQGAALNELAAQTAVWRSWYRRTVVLDALEYLHQHRRADPASRQR